MVHDLPPKCPIRGNIGGSPVAKPFMIIRIIRRLSTTLFMPLTDSNFITLSVDTVEKPGLAFSSHSPRIHETIGPRQAKGEGRSRCRVEQKQVESQRQSRQLTRTKIPQDTCAFFLLHTRLSPQPSCTGLSHLTGPLWLSYSPGRGTSSGVPPSPPKNLRSASKASACGGDAPQWHGPCSKPCTRACTRNRL